MEPLALSPQHAAKYLSLSKPTIYRLLAAGKLTGKSHGTRTLIDADSVKAYYASLPAYVAGNAIANAPRVIGATKRRRKA